MGGFCAGRRIATRKTWHRSLLGGKRAREPVETLVEAVARGGDRGLNVPLAVPQVLQAKLLAHICGRHRVRQVLLVGQDEEHRVAHLVLVQHLIELLLGVLDAVPVVAVHHVDEAVGALVVVAPERPDLVLAAHVPDREAQVLVLDRLHVEAYRRDGGHHFAKLQLVEDRRLTRCIEPDHQNAHLRLADEPRPYFRERCAHGG
mmetsp:Transcript_888/g.2773  ORF Transcript_888/g.2773 Transcript_888/m.2773 type:complete len:203 (-) Transcript_888:69-677(-)